MYPVSWTLILLWKVFTEEKAGRWHQTSSLQLSICVYPRKIKHRFIERCLYSLRKAMENTDAAFVTQLGTESIYILACKVPHLSFSKKSHYFPILPTTVLPSLLFISCAQKLISHDLSTLDFILLCYSSNIRIPGNLFNSSAA